MRPDLARPRRTLAAVVATVGTTSSTSVDPVRGDRRRVRTTRAPGSTSTPPTPARRGSARSCAGRRTASSAPTRSSSTRTSGCSSPMDCSLLWTSRPERLPRGVHARRPSTCARREDAFDALGLRPGARPPLPLAEALGGAALLRARGAAGDPSASTSGSRALFEELGARRAGLGARARRGRSRSSCFRRDGSDEENEALLERVNAAARSSSRTRSSTAATSCASRSATRGRRRTTSALAWDVLRREAERC